DLEQEAELVSERAPRALLSPGYIGNPEGEPDRGGEETARLQLVQRRLVGGGPGDVEVLAADHPERRLGELTGRARRWIREREAERLRQQRIAREHRDCLAELGPGARAAA